MDIVLAAEQIVKALVQRKAKVTAFVPHYAMSGGSLIALAADEIVKLPELKNPALISDEMLILVDVAAKARIQVGVFVAEVLAKRLARDKAAPCFHQHASHRLRPDGPLPAGRKRPAVGAPGFDGRVGRSYRWRMLFRSRD